MEGLILGMAMLIASTGALPAPESPRRTLAPAAITFAGERPFTPRDSTRSLPSDRFRSSGRLGAVRSSQGTSPQGSSKTAKIIAIAAGAGIGWMAGGAIGFYATSDWDEPDDGASGIRGLIIGAPIGAVVGAIIGHRVTR